MNYILDMVISALNLFLKSLNNIVFATILDLFCIQNMFFTLKYILTKTNSTNHITSKTI